MTRAHDAKSATRSTLKTQLDDEHQTLHGHESTIAATHSKCQFGHDHDFESGHADPPYPYGGRGHADPQPESSAIGVENLVVSYPGTSANAVDGVSLSVVRGERVALVGPNGAGKSTLLKALVGLVRPASGDIRIFGNQVGACHHRTSWLPQRSDLDWTFPLMVKDLVMTGRYVHLGWFLRPRRIDFEIVQQAMLRLKIEALAETQIGRLSGGQQQRVLLARALVQESDIFLLDEPLNAVDESTRDIVDEVLHDEVRRGGCVLAATHDLGRLSESFDRTICLKEGRISERDGGSVRC